MVASSNNKGLTSPRSSLVSVDTTSTSPSSKKTSSANIPKTMVECLEHDDPVAALQLLAAASAQRAATQAIELQADLQALSSIVLPELLQSMSVANASNNTSNTCPNEPTTSGDSQNSMTVIDRDHPYHAVATCADRVATTLDTISSGGSEASHDIRQLERCKRHVDVQHIAVTTALQWRLLAVRAEQSVQASAWLDAAQALQPWLLQQQQNQNSNSNSSNNNSNHDSDDPQQRLVRLYAGPDTMARLQNTYDALTQNLTSLYESAVANSDLQVLGQLTPILSVLNLEHEGLRLYKVYLDAILHKGMLEAVAEPKTTKNAKNQQQQQPEPPYAPMGRVYNTAVSVLRHHLPMVSHCLYKADGGVAVVQLVYSHSERAVVPIVQQYQRDRQLARVARTANAIYNALEERCTGQEHGGGGSRTMDASYNLNTDADDCGFVDAIGSLMDVDTSMDEAAICLQHSESYFRFVQHTCREVNRARQLRHEQAAERRRLEKERLEWTTGEKVDSVTAATTTGTGMDATHEGMEYKDLEILPTSTNLVKTLTELGNQYAGIERCLLLASMQRAFVQSNEDDPRSYRPMSTTTSSSKSGGGSGGSGSSGGNAGSAGSGGGSTAGAGGSNTGTSTALLQTTLVETCWYAARRCTQRALATGHVGTACAVVNYTVNCLNVVCLEVLTRRAEDFGVHALKPGEGLLVGGSGNLFNNAASNLLKHSGGVGSVGVSVVSGVSGSKAGGGPPHGSTSKHKEEWVRQQKRQEGIARACAVLNDLEVAIHHTRQLEVLLNAAVDKGYPTQPEQAAHETEQLRLCVKSLTTVAESFTLASNATIGSLEEVLKPRIRSIVSDAVGSSSDASFMGASSVISGKSADRDMVRMNYDLDEETYNLMQLSEGYITRLVTQLDELLQPLHRHVCPRQWDALLLTVMGSVAKRLETSLRKCQYTALGGLTLDADMRDLLHYCKDQLSSEYNLGSTGAILKACPALSKLLQIAKLLSVDDLDDVIDLMSGARRKGQWDLKLDDAKAFLSLRVEFDSSKIDELLRMPDDD